MLSLGWYPPALRGRTRSFSPALDISGFGFGNDPRALTIQAHGGPHNDSEAGCIAPNGSGGLIKGSTACAPADGLTGGDESNPLCFPKQAAPTLTSLGITNGNQIAILFDAVQPQNGSNNQVTIDDLTLKLYNGAALIFSVSGMFSPLVTNPGNGNSDYLFRLDANAVSDFNAAVSNNFGYRLALDSKLSFPRSTGGPESYTFEKIAPAPEPSSLLMLDTGIIGAASMMRRRLAAKT